MSGGEIVVVKRGGGDGSRYPLESGAATLGRGVSCDIRVLLSTVSEEQCIVTVHKNQALIRNLSDNNLTLVNGKPVQVKALDHGDVITMGDRSLRWEYFNKDRITKTTTAKMPAGKIKFSKKKHTATVVASGRRSEVAIRRIDPQVKKILDLKTRASLSDMQGSTRQIAVVKPQRRSADNLSAEAGVEPLGAPDTPSRRRGARGADTSNSHIQLAEIITEKRTSTEFKLRLLTKPHRGKSNSPVVRSTRRSLKNVRTSVTTHSDTSSVKSTPRATQGVTNVSTPKLAQVKQATPKSVQKTQYLTPGAKNTTPIVHKATPKLTNPKGIGKVLTPKLATPRLVKNATPKRETPKLTPKKGKTPTTGKKSTQQHVAVEKIDDPITIDANKKVALLLLTGRSPVKKIAPETKIETPKKAGSRRQTPAKAGSSRKKTHEFVIKRQSPIKLATPNKTDKKADTPKKSKTATPKDVSKTPNSYKPKVVATHEISVTPVVTTIEDAIVSPKTPKGRSTPNTPKGLATLNVSKETLTNVITPQNHSPTFTLSNAPMQKVLSSRKRKLTTDDESDVLESTLNISARKSIKDSIAGGKSATSKAINASLADESDVLESTLNVSAKKLIRDSSSGRKSVTAKSKNASLADESDVLGSTPNFSARKSIRDSSRGRKSGTPQYKNASLAYESDVLESTFNVSARKSIRDSSGGRKTVTPKCKNGSSADESNVWESTSNVSARKSIRDSSGGQKTATPKSKNASLAEESDLLDNTLNFSARKSIIDSSGGRKTATPKSKSLADGSYVSESTPNVSARKSTRDSSGGRKIATPKSQINVLATAPKDSIASAKNCKTPVLLQTEIIDKSPLSSGRKSAMKSPNNSVRKNESIKFDLSNLDKSQNNDISTRGKKRKSNNMTGESDVDLKLRFSDITEPSPKGSPAENLNESRSSSNISKTMNDSEISLPDISIKSNMGSPNVMTRKQSPRNAMVVKRALILNETVDINTSALSPQMSRMSAKHITGTVSDSDLDEVAESEKSQNVTSDRSKTRNSTIFLDSTEDRSEINTPKNIASTRTSRKLGVEYASDSYSIVDLVSDQSSNNDTIEKQTPKSTDKTSKPLLLDLTGNNSVNLKKSKSLIINKFIQNVTSTPLRKHDILSQSLVDNMTPVSSPIDIGKGPRFLLRSGKKSPSPKKTPPTSENKLLLSSKSMTVDSETKHHNVHRRFASVGTTTYMSRKSSNKGTPSEVLDSYGSSLAVPTFLYEDVSEASNRRSKSLGTPTNVSVDKLIKSKKKSINTSQKSPSTPENKIPELEATTPVLSVTDLLNASKGSLRRKSIRNTINHFESMSTPKTPVATQKVTRKSLGAIGERINRRKSELESLTDERKTRTDPRKVTRGIVKKNLKNTSLNVSAVKKISARENRKDDQSSSEQESVTSDTTDVNAQKPENDIVITPKSTIKLVPEILKEKHSTAKKPFSRKSIIDHLNESQEMVKELFRSPVKRKLSQSMVQYSAMQDSDDDLNDSINEMNNSSINVKPRNKRLSALLKQTPNQTPNVTFDFDSVKTPQVPTDIFVSPLDDSHTKRRSVRNSLLNFEGVKKLFSRNTPKNDLTDVRGLKSLMRTPGVRKSPKNDLTQIPTVKTLFATNKKKTKSPRNDLTKVQGVKKIFQSPRHQKSPKNDLTNVAGVKRMLKTPMQQKSPHNDLTKIPNVRHLFSSPGRSRKSPRNDLSNISGVTKIFRNPRSPRNALEELSGVEELFNGSSSTLKEEEISNLLFDKLIGKTPPKHTYQKSKSFVEDKEEPTMSRANKSMVPLEIIDNHVEDWLEKELERRTRRDSEISNNDEEANTSHLQKNASSKLNKSSKKTPKKALRVIHTSERGSSLKSKVDRALSKLVIDAVGGDVEITPNRRARRLVTEEKSNYSLEVSKATPSKINKSIAKILLPLKKRSISNDKSCLSGVKVTMTQNHQSERLSVHSEAEMSLPLKKRTIIKNDGALGHSTPVKKKLTPKKVQDSSIVDLGPVSPISKSLKDTPQLTQSPFEEQRDTLNATVSIEDSTATTRRGGRRQAPSKNTSSAMVERGTIRTRRNNTANLSKPNTPKPVSPRLTLEKKGTPKFSPSRKVITVEANTDTSVQPLVDINEEKSPKKRGSFKIITPKLNVAKKTLTRSKRGQKNLTEEMIGESNTVSIQGKVAKSEHTKRLRRDKVESISKTVEIVAEVSGSENLSITNTSQTPKEKAGRSRAVKKVASVDSPKPKSTRGRGKKSDSVQNETVDKNEELVLDVKKPVRGRGKAKNMTIETENASESSVNESHKVSSPTDFKGQQQSVEKDISVQDSPKQTLKRVQKATSKVMEAISNEDNVSVQGSAKPVAKRGRRAATKIAEIQGDVSTQDSPKPAAKRTRKAAAPKVDEEIANKEDISVQDSPKPASKRGRKAAVSKVAEVMQVESTNKEEIAVPESPKPAPKRARKPVSKAIADIQQESINKEASSKQPGRRKRVVKEKEALTEEVKPSPPKKERGRGKVVENDSEANVSNTESATARPKGGRRKKEEGESSKKVTFAESTADEHTSTTTGAAKRAPNGRASRRRAADAPEVESEDATSITSAKTADNVLPKRGRRGPEETTDSSNEAVKEAPKTVRGKKANNIISSPTESKEGNASNGVNTPLVHCEAKPSCVEKYTIDELVCDFNRKTLRKKDVCSFLHFCSTQINQSVCNEIEKLTVDQAKCGLWFDMRYGRITASRAYEVTRCKKLNENLVWKILGESSFHGSFAVRRGSSLELEVLIAVQEKLNVKFVKCGFFLNCKYPVLGASPDGINEQYIVEIKCPIREDTMKNYFTLEEKPTPKYMAQIQLQMLIAEKKMALFCIAHPDFELSKNVKIIRVEYDEIYCSQLIRDCNMFWSKAISLAQS